MDCLANVTLPISFMAMSVRDLYEGFWQWWKENSDCPSLLNFATFLPSAVNSSCFFTAFGLEDHHKFNISCSHSYIIQFFMHNYIHSITNTFMVLQICGNWNSHGLISLDSHEHFPLSPQLPPESQIVNRAPDIHYFSQLTHSMTKA